MKNMTSTAGRLSWLTVYLWSCFFTIQCAQKDTGPTFRDETEAEVLDILTSATPGAQSAVLDSAHPGWSKPNCDLCHGNLHESDFGIAACVHCHGTNGAPPREQGHRDTGCTDASCHPGIHGERHRFELADCRSCHQFQTLDGQCRQTETYDVVIIGAGGGGLGAAAVLSHSGLGVLLIEQSFDVGGCMTTFRRGDYRIEGSLFGTDGLGIQTLLGYEQLGIKDKAHPVRAEPYIYQLYYPEFQFNVPSDIEEYQTQLATMFPDQEQALSSLFDELTDFSRALGTAEHTFGALLHKHGITNKRLISMLTRLGSSFGTDPDNLPASLFATLWHSMHVLGHYYWIGGSQSVANALRDTFLENNGTLKLLTKATRIDMENGLAARVRTEDGGCYNADYIISNANAPDTFFRFVGKEHLPVDFVQNLESQEPGLSGFHVYLGVDHDYTSLFGDTYGIMVSEDIDPWTHYHAAESCDVEKIDYVLVNYTMEDPTNAAAGKNVITINAQLSYDCFETWGGKHSSASYNETKTEAALKLIKRAEKILPNLTDHIEVLEVGTPHTIESFTLNPRGTIFGGAMAQGETRNASDPAISRTPIPNLFLVGAWAIGGGQWVVVYNGATAAELILQDDQHQPSD